MYDKLLLLPLFQGLAKEDFTRILEKVRLHFQKHPAGSCIARQDDPCTGIVFVLQGEVRSEAADAEQGYMLSERLPAPCVIEPYSLFGMHPRYAASYYAQEDTGVVAVHKQYVLSELCQYEIFRLNYLNMLSNRSQVICRKLWHTHPGRTLGKIVNFLQLRCTLPTGEKKLRIRMEDLATLTDDTRINVSKALNELQDGGLIRLSRKEIQIPDFARLCDYARQEGK